MNKTSNEKYLLAFGAQLRKLRKKQGMTMMELAFEANVEYSQIARIERGLSNATISTVYVLSVALGLKPSDLLDFPFPSKTAEK